MRESTINVVGKDGISQKTYSYTDYGETTEQGENDFYNEVCYGGGIYDKTTGLYYLNARYYSPENGSFLTQDTYRGSRSKTETLNLYGYCAGNPISYTDPSGHWIWGVVGAAMGAYDGYKYAKKKGYKGWKKYAAIAGGAALGVVNPFKVFKVAKTGYKTYKAVKYSKKARAAYKATKVTKKAKAKPKHTVVMKKNTKAKIQSKPAVRNSKGIKKLQKSAGGTIGCFTAGTKIHTKDGFKAIETIQAGDYVWSENPETHEKALKKVKKIFVREKDSVVRLSINGEAIETTNEHPFYVEGHGWTNAYDLKVGDKVRLEDGTTGTVEKAKHVALDTPVTVYNFEVEDFHTYYVSEQKVLVHNTCAATAKNTQVAKSSNNVSANKTFGNSGTVQESTSYDTEFLEWLNKGESDNTVYFGMVGDVAKYTGITKQGLNKRLQQHIKKGKPFSNLLAKHEGLTRNQARALEQYYIENGPNELNKINSISPNHRNYQQAMNWAKDYIDSH